jgi:hypothetical protein
LVELADNDFDCLRQQTLITTTLIGWACRLMCRGIWNLNKQCCDISLWPFFHCLLIRYFVLQEDLFCISYYRIVRTVVQFHSVKDIICGYHGLFIHHCVFDQQSVYEWKCMELWRQDCIKMCSTILKKMIKVLILHLLAASVVIYDNKISVHPWLRLLNGEFVHRLNTPVHQNPVNCHFIDHVIIIYIPSIHGPLLQLIYLFDSVSLLNLPWKK